MDLDADFQAFESVGGSRGGIHIPGNPANNISVRQNNPFNIKGKFWGATGTGTRGFAIYPTPEAGWQAGISQLALDHSRPFTVRQFQEKYAPTYENPTYLRDLTALAGVSPDDPISKIPLNVLVQSVAKLESGARGPLPGGGFRRAEKVAAKTKPQIDLDADFEAFVQQNPAPQPVAPGAEGLTPDLKNAYNKDFPREAPPEAPWYMRAAQTVGEIAEKPGIKQALWALDLPMKPIRAGLEKIHEKVIEPQRERTEQEAAAFVQNPGAGAAAPEAFAPLPSKNAFVIPMEMALAPSVYGKVGKALGWAGRGFKGKRVASPAGPSTGVSEGLDLEERIAAAASVGGSPELGIEAATAAKPISTPSFLQPPTTPWAAGPIQRGLPATQTLPGRAVPVYPRFSRMERPQLALPPGESTVEVLPATQPSAGRAVPVYPRVSRMKGQLRLPEGAKGAPPSPPSSPFEWPSFEAEIKAARDARKTKAILNNIKGMKGMGNDEEVSRLLEMLSKLGGG